MTGTTKDRKTFRQYDILFSRILLLTDPDKFQEDLDYTPFARASNDVQSRYYVYLAS